MSKILQAIREAQKGNWNLDEEDLLEMGPEIIPDLIEIYRHETHKGTRQFLVEVICGFNQHDVIPFMSEALCYDEDPWIWERILQGLIMVACPEAVQALRSARSRIFPEMEQTEKFQRWLEESIIKVEEEIRQLDPELPSIYVALTNVDEDAWVPVKAQHQQNNIYKIVSENVRKDCEEWQFTAGDIVRCEEMDLYEATTLKRCLVAIERECSGQ
jgi:hypothetical protein